MNFAFLMFSGKSQAAADPLARALDPNHTAHIPDPAQVLRYNPGNIQGSINNFGGTAAAEYGPVLLSPYINGTSSFILAENNRQILSQNPCKFTSSGNGNAQ